MIDFDKKPFESFAFVLMSLLVVGLVIYGIVDYIDKNMTPVEREAYGNPLDLKDIKASHDGKYIVEQYEEYRVLGVASDDKGSDKKYIRIEDDLYNDVLAYAAQASEKVTKIDISALEKRLEEKSKADSDIVKWLKDHPGIGLLLCLAVLLFLAIIFSR